MSSNMARVETRAGKRKRECDAHAGEAIPGLLVDVVVERILRSDSLPDPADLARLRPVSRAMCDAVAATGRRIKKADEWEAARFGYLTTLQCLRREKGRLYEDESLCQAAARSGQLEELKLLRADGCPWDEGTCKGAAANGSLEMLKWVRAKGCPWDEWTCAMAAQGGHFEVLK